MQPNLIKSTAGSANTLLDIRGYGSPEAFLLSYVAWEGLKVRLLVVGLHMHGWAVADIYEQLPAGKIFQEKNYNSVFRWVFGSPPASTKGIGEDWKSIDQFKDIRHRYVHGASGASPDKLEAATHLITERVLEPEWLTTMKVNMLEGKPSLGNPYRKLVTSRTRKRSKSSLHEILKSSIKR